MKIKNQLTTMLETGKFTISSNWVTLFMDDGEFIVMETGKPYEDFESDSEHEADFWRRWENRYYEGKNLLEALMALEKSSENFGDKEK